MSKLNEKFFEILPTLTLIFWLLLGLVFSYEMRIIPLPNGIEYDRAINMIRFLPFVLGGGLSFIGLSRNLRKREK